MMKVPNILHIAAHIGGGIGSAVAGLKTCKLKQTILLLEKPINQSTLSGVKEAGFFVIEQPDAGTVNNELSKADVVLFHWSHHPAVTDLLLNGLSVPIRTILWCHVSGNYFPHISAEFLKKFDRVMFAAPYSLNLPHVKAFGESYIKERFNIVYGLGPIAKFANVPKSRDRNKFVIGYVGTLGFCKLHPRFVDFCAAVNIPGVRFVLAGEPATKSEILKAANQAGIAGKIVFCGHVADVSEVLASMDVFSYLLNPQHFGATENALLEAMAAGLPAVALNQCVESFIIKNGETGLLVNSPETYAEAVNTLWKDKTSGRKLGKSARADVLSRFDAEDNCTEFILCCYKAMDVPKKIHYFNDFFGKTPSDWFLSCVEADRQCFLENRAHDAGLIFFETTKSSPNHYNTYFPGDERLAFWTNQLKSKAMEEND